MNGGSHLRGGGDIMSDLTDPVIEPQTSRIESDVFHNFCNFYFATSSEDW